jgi:hypothetical protein
MIRVTLQLLRNAVTYDVTAITAVLSPLRYKELMKKKLQNAAAQNPRKDYVGRSGVYPMSGPHPKGNAPIRGQMEWGQGERGAMGYYDHGSSALTMDSGVLVGGFDQRWTGAPERGVPVSPVTEIPVAEWPAFCEWFTDNFHGYIVSVERQQEGESTIIARQSLFLELTAHLLENSVAAITVVAEGKLKKIRLNVAGPRTLTFHRKTTGSPLKLEIGHAKGRVTIYCNGAIETPAGMSSNAWGE